MRSRLFCITLLLVLVASVPTAVADGGSAVDPAGDNTDPDGDSTPLDIAELAYGHRRLGTARAAPRDLTLKVTMHDEWENSVLEERAHQISFHFWTNKRDCLDRVLNVGLNEDGSLYAVMLGGCSGPAEFHGYPRIWRSDPSSFKVRFQPTMLAKDLRRFGVRVLTSNTGGECQRPSGESTEPCEDVAPDDGFLVHRM
jgi:hypothetical protein